MTDGLTDKDRFGIRSALKGCPKVQRAVLFGSRAIGTFRGASDIDLALEGEDIRLSDLTFLKAQIEKLNLPIEVDLIIRGNIQSPDLEKHIADYGREWYRKDLQMKPLQQVIDEGLLEIGDGGRAKNSERSRNSLTAKKRSIMVGEWKVCKLRECCDFNPSSISSAWPHLTLRYIDISSIGEGIATETPKVLLRSEAPSRAQRLVAPGDSLLSTVRPNRRSMIWLGSPPDDLVASTGFAVLRAKSGIMSPRFLYYTVFNQSFTEYLITREKGAAYPAVSISDIGDADIRIPPLTEQKRIAAVLGALDDKIECNRRMNATLEAMARALFKSWFVDFDPVRRNRDRNAPPAAASDSANRQCPANSANSAVSAPSNPQRAVAANRDLASQESPEKPANHDLRNLAQDKSSANSHHASVANGELAAHESAAKPVNREPAAAVSASLNAIENLESLDALFPAAFQDSALGEIPEGWSTEPVGEIVDCVGGGTPSTADPKYWENGTHHWTTPKDFSSLQAPILLDTDRKLTDAGIAKISSGLLPAGTLLLSSRAPVGYLAIAAMPVAINQGFIAMKCNERASNYFMLNWCQTNMIEIEGRATGTTFAEISKRNFRPILLVLPSKELVDIFTSQVASFYAQIAANLKQSRTLTVLRDTLLPKLLSGELSVAELEIL